MPEPDRGSARWLRVGAIVAVLVLAFVAARSCQQDQVRVTKEQAIATAEAQVDFESEGAQVRFLRQGLDRRPFWFVSLSVTSEEDPDVFSHLAVVQVDANTGKVESIKLQAERDRLAAGISVSEEDAVDTARGEVDFTATETQVRLRREGADAPAWVVSLSTSTSETVTDVTVDAVSGEVIATEERAAAR